MLVSSTDELSQGLRKDMQFKSKHGCGELYIDLKKLKTKKILKVTIFLIFPSAIRFRKK